MDLLVPSFAKRLHSATSSGLSLDAARTVAFDGVCAEEASDLVLTQSLAASLPSLDAFDALRRRVCQQIALSSFLCHMLGVGDRSLHKVRALVCRSPRVLLPWGVLWVSGCVSTVLPVLLWGCSSSPSSSVVVRS